MKKLTTLLAVICVLSLSSCSTSKKLKSAEADNAQLQAKNTELTNNNNDLQKQVNDLTASNKSTTDNFNSYKTSCEATKAKMQAMQAYINDQYKVLQEVEKKLEAAEANFKSKGVDVYYKDGYVYVRMQDALLYKPASAQLDPKGKQALANLASVLNDYPNLQVFVVGNTDTATYKGAKDNWNLSTERANGVVRILTNDYKVSPSRLVAAGRSKFNPIANNNTAEGRAQNRRTDIILNPDLVKMWQNAQMEVGSK